MKRTTMKDNVNHPSHYAEDVYIKAECIMFTRHLDFDTGNAFKYVWRAGKKDDIVQDLRKAIWYLNDSLNTEFLGLRMYAQFLIPFVPTCGLPDWKVEILKLLLKGETKLAIKKIRRILKRAH